MTLCAGRSSGILDLAPEEATFEGLDDMRRIDLAESLQSALGACDRRSAIRQNLPVPQVQRV